MKEYIKPLSETVKINTEYSILSSSSYPTYRTHSDDYNELKNELNIIKQQNKELINIINSLKNKPNNNDIEN